jgi:heat shock protein 4
LGYGITKSDLPEPENPRNIAFVDVGHSCFSVAIVAFSKGQLSIQSTAYNHNLGGRDIDYLLTRHFSEEFKSKYKIDVLANPKAVFRLAAGCEKLKKVLSANIEGPLNIESIMNDIDASSKLNRDQLETLMSPLLDGIQAPIKQALADSGLTVEQIDSVELVGGSSRIPAVRNRIQQAFDNKPLSLTLNQDEAVARGATFACAMLSPVFRVRDFHIHDINHYPVRVQWQPLPTDPDEDTEILLFPQGNAIPSTKILSFYRRQPFHVDAAYTDPSGLPGGIPPVIGGFDVTDVPPDPKGDSTVVKVKARLNLHGIVSFENTYVEEIEEKEVEPAPMDVDQQNAAATASETAEGEAAPPVPPKKKRIVKKKEVPFVTSTSSLDRKIIEQSRERESQMHAADKLVQDTEVRIFTLFSTREVSYTLSSGSQKCFGRIHLRYP